MTAAERHTGHRGATTPLVLALVAVVMVLASAGLRNEAEQEPAEQEPEDAAERAKRPDGMLSAGGRHGTSRR